MTTVKIRKMHPEDWPEVAAIYRQGIETGNATLETEVPSFEKWDAAHCRNCRLVAFGEEDGKVEGWSVLSPVSARRVYGGVAEVSVYVSWERRGRKIGEALLGALVEESEKEGYWTLQSSIFEENTPSLSLHHKCGFRTVGLRRRIGRDSKGKWRNLFLLERRSDKVGVD